MKLGAQNHFACSNHLNQLQRVVEQGYSDHFKQAYSDHVGFVTDFVPSPSTAKGKE